MTPDPDYLPIDPEDCPHCLHFRWLHGPDGCTAVDNLGNRCACDVTP